MSLQVTTKPCNLTSARKKYQFISKNAGKIPLRQLLEMAAKSNTTITLADLEGGVRILYETAQKLLLDGYRIEFLFTDLYIKASGSAASPEIPFTPRHERSTDHRFRLHAVVHKHERRIDGSDVRWTRKEFNSYRYSPVITKAAVWDDCQIYIEGKKLCFDQSRSFDGVKLYTEHSNDPINPVEYQILENTRILAKFAPLAPGRYTLNVVNRGNTGSFVLPLAIPAQPTPQVE